jgi:hypothetical protein
MTTRMAGSEPVLPLILAVSGMLPSISAEESRAAAEQLRRLDPALLAHVQGLAAAIERKGVSPPEALAMAENAGQGLQRVFDQAGFLR